MALIETYNHCYSNIADISGALFTLGLSRHQRVGANLKSVPEMSILFVSQRLLFFYFTVGKNLPVDLLRGMESDRVRVIFGRFGSNFVFLDERGSWSDMKSIILERGPPIGGSAEASLFFNEDRRSSEVFIFWFCESPKTDFENDENHF